MDKHSQKGLKTLELMKTIPTDWSLTPIKWVKLLKTVPTKVKCPACYGNGRTYINNETGKVALDANFKNINDRSETGWKSKNSYDKCPTCSTARSSYKGSGEITVMKEQEVLVGIPVWAKGTVFDSRFSEKIYDRPETASGKSVKHVCDLCSKSITGVWSHRVPVNARGADGQLHGMWVGEDCAKKILGVEIVLSPEQAAELKKSVYKNWIIKENT